MRKAQVLTLEYANLLKTRCDLVSKDLFMLNDNIEFGFKRALRQISIINQIFVKILFKFVEIRLNSRITTISSILYSIVYSHSNKNS